MPFLNKTQYPLVRSNSLTNVGHGGAGRESGLTRAFLPRYRTSQTSEDMERFRDETSAIAFCNWRGIARCCFGDLGPYKGEQRIHESQNSKGRSIVSTYMQKPVQTEQTSLIGSVLSRIQHAGDSLYMTIRKLIVRRRRIERSRI